MESNKPYFFMKVFEIPLYGRDLIVVLTNSDEELAKRKLPVMEHEIYASALEKVYWKKKWSDMVLLNTEDPTPYPITNGIIAHEAMHVTNSVMRRIGAETENEETHAYLLEWVTDRIHQTINEYKKKNDILLKP
jgi:hypothetical protein